MGTDLGCVGEGASAVADRVLSPSATEPEVSAHTGNAPLRVLSLFAGIGGFDLGLERIGGFRTVRFVEIDPYCRAILEQHWPGIRKDADIKECEFVEGEADIVCGGFPCIDISNAGNKRGIEGEHSGLWSEMARAIGTVRPRYAIIENVSALLSRGLERVLCDLAALGYDAEWHCIPAAYVGAPQGRDRIWIVAYPGEWGREGLEERHGEGPRLVIGNDHDGLALGQRRAREAASRIRRMDERTPNGMDRLKACGNIAHPANVELIGRAILEAIAMARDSAETLAAPVPQDCQARACKASPNVPSILSTPSPDPRRIA